MSVSHSTRRRRPPGTGSSPIASPRASRSSWPLTAIIGGGMVGSLFGRLLREAGSSPAMVVSRTLASARRAAGFIGGGAVGAAIFLRDLPRDTRLVIVATPHDTIAAVAAELATVTALDFGRLFVCHASGMLTAAALEPLAARGATVFSFHPLQSFPRHLPPAALLDSARGITYGVDGTEKALGMARRLARRLSGGRTLVVPPALRVFYHAASVVASTHLVALLSMLEAMHATLLSEAAPTEAPGAAATAKQPATGARRKGEALRAAGSKGRHSGAFYRVFEPLIASTLHLVETRSPREAVGGAIARGGVETLRAHLEAVVAHQPHLALPFSVLSAQAIELVEARGAIDPRLIAEMRAVVAPRTPRRP